MAYSSVSDPVENKLMENLQNTNGLTIVTANYNSSKLLEKLLESIQCNGESVFPLEVLIVDDSSPLEAEAARDLCCKYGMRYLWCRGNVARKRNFGVENASYPIILFTDSDCELSLAAIPEHMKLASTGPEIGAMLGVVEFTGPVNWIWHVVERTGLVGAYSFARRMSYAPWGITANLSVKRAVLQKIGGFDESFLKAPGGEDVDLGLRINDAGYKISCNPDALIFHTRATWNTLGRMLRRAFAYGRAHYHVIIKHLTRTGYEYPRFASVLFLIFLLLLIRALITFRWQPLAGCVLFPFAVLLCQAFLVLRLERLGVQELPREVLAHVLDLTFECGLIFESLRRLDLRGFWVKMIYAERQLNNERSRKIIQAWSLIGGFLVLLILL
jgi:glycosyltransferase involved in cell wall biosynthesis